jgi:hypothetical protein
MSRYILGMTPAPQTLANRLGGTLHRSPLRHRLRRLMTQHADADAECLEDWLVDLANSRGATVVPRTRQEESPKGISANLVSNEELVVALLQPHSLDRPQIIRLAAQLISREAVDLKRLLFLARAERCELVLGEVAKQALKVAPDHGLWGAIRAALPTPTPRSPIVHWNRLAWPRMNHRAPNAAAWELVR